MITDRLLLKLEAIGLDWLVPYERMAEARWRHHNERARTGDCGCGKPVTVLSQAYHDVVGSVPYESWTCHECAGADCWSNGEPLWSYPSRCPECGDLGGRGRIGEPELYAYFCKHRPGTRPS
ncbi:hypothetical protein [Streptomyces sp. NPDC015131]|uniref:hypothetical protein n=1 Tax=Streptomyces sp. NPDC015131 TaxID=3364941 RepID=UPI0036F8899F